MSTSETQENKIIYQNIKPYFDNGSRSSYYLKKILYENGSYSIYINYTSLSNLVSGNLDPTNQINDLLSEYVFMDKIPIQDNLEEIIKVLESIDTININNNALINFIENIKNNKIKEQNRFQLQMDNLELKTEKLELINTIKEINENLKKNNVLLTTYIKDLEKKNLLLIDAIYDIKKNDKRK